MQYGMEVLRDVKGKFREGSQNSSRNKAVKAARPWRGSALRQQEFDIRVL